MFDVKGQWTITESANGNTFTRVDTVLPDEKKLIKPCNNERQIYLLDFANFD
jgi:hypothetical protein